MSFTLYRTRRVVHRLYALVASLHTTIAEQDGGLRAERRERQSASEMDTTLRAELANRETTLEAERCERERVERVVATPQSDINGLEATLRLLVALQVRLLRLAGLLRSPGAGANFLWNPAARERILLTAGLPQLPCDRVYGLWLIAGTAEPARGMPEPTGPIHLQGDLGAGRRPAGEAHRQNGST